METQRAWNAGVPLSTANLFCIWFSDAVAAGDAYNELILAKIIDDDTDVVFVKPMSGNERGWGFKDHELGTMAKLAAGG